MTESEDLVVGSEEWWSAEIDRLQAVANESRTAFVLFVGIDDPFSSTMTRLGAWRDAYASIGLCEAAKACILKSIEPD